MTGRRFPDGFRWGVATSGHQIEGGNVNSDWWQWEHATGTPCAEPSGDACDHLNRYVQDLALVASLGFDTFRMSVEWSRIEPEPGQFSRAALDHYRRVCAACRDFGLEPIVTFHHFTSPRWFATAGGWSDPGSVDRFTRFCEVTSRHLRGLVGRACTINEPNVMAFATHQLGVFPPGTLDDLAFGAMQEHLRSAHVAATGVLKGELGDVPVGLALGMVDYQPDPPDDVEAVDQRDRLRARWEDFYLQACSADDFIGVQTYTRRRIGPDGSTLRPTGERDRLAMGYEFYPEALAATIRRASAVTGGVPVLVTENGIGTSDDDQRLRYLRTALDGVLDCLDEGIEVDGYLCWSLLDNFEWVFGYGPQFGIVAVDRATQERTPKPSARWLGGIARANALDAGPSLEPSQEPSQESGRESGESPSTREDATT